MGLNTMQSSSTQNSRDNLSNAVYSAIPTLSARPALSKKGPIRLKPFPFRNRRRNWISQKNIRLTAAFTVIACVTLTTFVYNTQSTALESSESRCVHRCLFTNHADAGWDFVGANWHWI